MKKLKKRQQGGPGPLWLLPGRQNPLQFNMQCPEGYTWSTQQGKCIPNVIQPQSPISNYLTPKTTKTPDPVTVGMKQGIPNRGLDTSSNLKTGSGGEETEHTQDAGPAKEHSDGEQQDVHQDSTNPQFETKSKATFGNIDYGYRALSNSIQGIAAFFREKHNRAGQDAYYRAQFNPLTYIPETGNTSEQNQFGMSYNKKGGLTPNKARKILHDGTVHGHPITEKQRRFFGVKSEGNTLKYPDGGLTEDDPKKKKKTNTIINPKTDPLRPVGLGNTSIDNTNNIIPKKLGVQVEQQINESRNSDNKKANKFLNDYYSYAVEKVPFYHDLSSFDSIDVRFARGDRNIKNVNRLKKELDTITRYDEKSERKSDSLSYYTGYVDFIRDPKLRKKAEEEMATEYDNFRKKPITDLNDSENLIFVKDPWKEGKSIVYGQYNRGSKTLQVSDKPNRLNTLVHERSHKADQSKLSKGYEEEKEFNKNIDLNQYQYSDIKRLENQYKYLSNFSERQARHRTTQFWLSQNLKGYDFKKPITEKEFDFLMKNRDNLPFDVQQLISLYASNKDIFIKNINKFKDGGMTYPGPQKGFQKDIVYIDKGKGKMYFYDDKGNLQEKEVLTGKNRKGHILNPYTTLNTNSENEKDREKITPIGMFPLSDIQTIYGNPGLNVIGTKDKKGASIAIHNTYDPANRNKFYYNNNVEDNAQSYGCINCNKSESDRIAKLYANKKVYIYDSNLSDEENQKYNAVNNLIAKDNSLYGTLSSTFDKSKVVSYRKGRDGKLYSSTGSYDPTTETMIPNSDMKEVIVKASRTKQLPKPILEKEEPQSNNITRQRIPVTSTDIKTPIISRDTPTIERNIQTDERNPSIVDFLSQSGKDFSFKARKELAKKNGISDYRGTANQNLKLLSILRDDNTETNSRKKMEDGGPTDFESEIENELIDEPKVNTEEATEDQNNTQESPQEETTEGGDDWMTEFLMGDSKSNRSIQNRFDYSQESNNGDIVQAFKKGIANVESNGDYFAQAKGSTAFGKYQFTKGTLETVRKNFFPQIKSKDFEMTYKTDPQFQERVMDVYSKYLLSTSNTPQEAALKHFLGESGYKRAKSPSYNPGGNNMNVGSYVNKFNKGFRYKQGGVYEVSEDEIENLKSQGYDIEIL